MTNRKWKRSTIASSASKDNICCQLPHLVFIWSLKMSLCTISLTKHVESVPLKCLEKSITLSFFYSPPYFGHDTELNSNSNSKDGLGFCLFNDQFRLLHAQFTHNKPTHQSTSIPLLCSDRWFKLEQAGS